MKNTNNLKRKSMRTCNHCHKQIEEGYVFRGGEAYYCSPEHFYANHPEFSQYSLDELIETGEDKEYYQIEDDDLYWTVFEDDYS